MEYEVKLEIFEGPLDLLLHLIQKNEVDIFDIPITKITDQYLEYLDIMQALNINVAGDFLVMAATLIHIKSKMLLPELKGEEEEEEDPRAEITRPLIEYMKFKEIAGDFSERELLQRDVFARRMQPYLSEQLEKEGAELDVNLFQLMDAFRRIVDKKLPGVQLKLQLQKWSVKEKTEFIITHLKQKGHIFFRDLFTEDRTISEFIVTFLALLELIHIGLIKALQPTAEGEIRLELSMDENGDKNNG